MRAFADPARSPTTTGKIERFHRTLRAEFDTSRVFTNLRTAQQALEEWVGYYNTARPHQALERCHPGGTVRPARPGHGDPSRAGCRREEAAAAPRRR